MIDSIVHRNLRNGERIDPFQAAHVEPVLLRVRAPLVMGVDPAVATEVVPGRVGVELVAPQVLRTLDHADALQGHRGDHRALGAADGAVAAVQVERSMSDYF